MKRYMLLCLSVLTLSVLAGALTSRIGGQATAAIRSLVTTTPVAKKTVAPIAGMNDALQAAVDSDQKIHASVTLVDLDTGITYQAGLTQSFTAASTTKVLTAVAYLHEVELGKATLDQTLDNGMTAQQAMQQMIEVSDNDAWAALDDALGSYRTTYAQALGMKSFDASDNSITTADEAKLLTKLAQGSLLTNAHQELLYNLMANTDSTNLISAILPTGSTVYHKYGELGSELHDAAIVTMGSHHFILVIFTNSQTGDSSLYDQQVSVIHAIIQADVTTFTVQ